MKCRYCNTKNTEDTKFCINCGKSIEEKTINKNTAIIAVIISAIVVLVVISIVLFNTEFNTDAKSEGEEITINTNSSTKTDDTELSYFEKEDILDLINSNACGFFIERNQYSKPSEINLSYVFYNSGTKDINEDEMMDVFGYKDDWARKISLPMVIYKYEYYTNEHITKEEAIERMPLHKYNEKYDAFYSSNSSNGCFNRRIVSSSKDGNIYTLHLEVDSNYNSNTQTVVTLKREGNTYYIISNLKE